MSSLAQSGHGDLSGYQSVNDEREVAFYRVGDNGEVACPNEDIARRTRRRPIQVWPGP